jgi:hypothetical protein
LSELPLSLPQPFPDFAKSALNAIFQPLWASKRFTIPFPEAAVDDPVIDYGEHNRGDEIPGANWDHTFNLPSLACALYK